MKRTRSHYYAPSHEATELYLYTSSNYCIYTAIIKSTIKNLARFKLKGEYDTDKALDAWYWVACAGAKAYEHDFGGKFTPTEKFTAACRLQECYFDEIEEELERLR